MTTVQAAPGDVIVQLDVFPADALLPDGATTYLGVRAAVADGQVQLWRNEAPGPALVWTAPLTGWAGGPRTGWTLQTDRGPVFVDYSGGCRCGQRLATADLWPGKRRVNTSL